MIQTHDYSNFTVVSKLKDIIKFKNDTKDKVITHKKHNFSEMLRTCCSTSTNPTIS